jgi:hypothetical protein
LNKIQKSVLSVTIPLIIILISFVLIGSGGSVSEATSGLVGNKVIIFNPFEYFSMHGIEWSIVVFIISLFEFFWWKDSKKKTN